MEKGRKSKQLSPGRAFGLASSVRLLVEFCAEIGLSRQKGKRTGRGQRDPKRFNLRDVCGRGWHTRVQSSTDSIGISLRERTVVLFCEVYAGE